MLRRSCYGQWHSFSNFKEFYLFCRPSAPCYKYNIFIIYYIYFNVYLATMGIQISRLFFSCCCKVEDLGSRCSSTASSSPQHLLAQSPSSSSESREITSDPSCKLCLSEDNQRDTAVIYYRASVISLRPLALIIPNFLKPEECQVD